jgi:hypothetical protein
MRDCTADVLPYCFKDAAAYVAKGGARPDHAQIASVGSQATGSIEDDYAIQWISLPAAPADVTVTNTAAGGVLRATGVCTAGSQPLRVPFPSSAIGAGQSSTIQAFPPDNCTGAAVVLTTATHSSPDPTASTMRGYTVATAPPSRTLSVTLAGTGSGLVATDPSGIFCGVLCSAPFPSGSKVTLGASPAKTSTFTGWSGACSGTETLCEVAMDQAKSVTATFTLIPADASPTPTATGTATTTPPPVEPGPSGGDSGLATDTTAPRITIDRLKLARNKRSLTVRITCPPTEPHRCSGFLALTSKAAGKRLNFGQQAFLAVRGGSRKTLKFAVTSRSRRAMARVRKLRVTIKSRTRDDAFNYATQTKKLSLKVRR